MSAAFPTSSTSQAVPPASPPPEIHHDPDPDPTPTAIAPSEVVTETKPDEFITSLPPALRSQSPVQPPGFVDRPARVESHAPDPAPAPRSVPARSHAALTTSLIEGERPLPAVPANVTLPPETSLRTRVASDPGNGDAHRPLRRSEIHLVHTLERPGSRVSRQRPSTHPGEFEWPPARVTSPSQVRPLAPTLLGRVVTTWHWLRVSPTLPGQWALGYTLRWKKR